MITPLGERVLILEDERKTETPGGLVLPQAAQERSYSGVILSVGKKVRDVTVGERVLFEKNAGTEMKIDGSPVVMLKENQIVGVLESA